MPRSGLPEPRNFDADYCIKLHNQIVAAALTTNPDIGVTKGYFTCHAQESPHMQSHLDWIREDLDNEDFLRFLDNLDIPNAELSFTPEVFGLTIPSEMWYPEGSPIPDTWFVPLYRAHEWEGGRGLMFDLETMSATFVDGFFEDVISDSPVFQRAWLSLDTILEKWCAREDGKYVPVHRDDPIPIIADQEPKGWRMIPFRPADLVDTVQAWDEYVEAIVSRMPPVPPTKPESPPPQDLTPHLDEYNIRGFLRSFILSVRRPPSTLRFIAPGLLFPTLEFLTHTLSHTHDRQLVLDGYYFDPDSLDLSVVPTTLFPLVASSSNQTTSFEGLVLSVDSSTWADSVALLLPSDTATLPDSVPKPQTSRGMNGFFQPGQCPFGFDHSVRFSIVLLVWKELIENGVWGVDGEGVIGGEQWWDTTRNSGEVFKIEEPCWM